MTATSRRSARIGDETALPDSLSLLWRGKLRRLVPGKISNESPIGKAILNHEVGETVSVETPGGTYKVKIISVK